MGIKLTFVCCAEFVKEGSLQSFDCSSLMTGSSRQAAAHNRKFEVLVLNDCFHLDRTFAAVATYVSHADEADIGDLVLMLNHKKPVRGV